MKLAEKVATLEATLPAIHAELKRMNEQIEGLDHVIRGNGSPGLVEKVAAHSLKMKLMEEGRSRWRDAFFTVCGGIVVGIVVFLFSDIWSNNHGQQNLPQVQQVTRNR